MASTESRVLSAEEPVPSAVMPVSSGEQQRVSGEQQAPDAELQGPGGEQPIPGVEFQGLSTESTGVNGDLPAPSAEYQAVSAEPDGTGGDSQVSSAELESASGDSQAPSIESQTPSIEYQTPGIEGQTSGIESQTPSIESQAPSIDFQASGDGYQVSSTELNGGSQAPSAESESADGGSQAPSMEYAMASAEPGMAVAEGDSQEAKGEPAVVSTGEEAQAASGPAQPGADQRELKTQNSKLKTDYSRDRLPRLVHWMVILGLFGVALWLRANDLETIPPGFWFDEAQNGTVGMQLVGPNAFHAIFVGDWTQMGALYFYFVGLAVKVFGLMIWPTRILPALGGALIAPMLYVLATHLYGWRAGLAAGGLVAVSSWNITMSRFGMASLPTVALDVAVYLCVVQALRTGRLGYYAAAGVLLGLAEHIYYASRLVPVVLAVIFVHRLITERMKLIRSVRAGIPVFAVGALLAFLPMGLFAVESPEVYNARTDTVSVFSKMNSPNDAALRQNLEFNARRHLLMFGWEGDGNGRHNLPGAPMLDWITNALFVAGVASCALRAWRWQYMFPIVWGLAAISGGVFSLPFEAPQSHRTLENSVVTALIAGIFLGETWQALAGGAMVDRLTGFFRFIFRRRTIVGARPLRWPMRVAWAVSGATLLLALYWIGGINIHRYFDVQARDMSVWQDMNAPQAQVAHAIQKYGKTHDIYVTAVYMGTPPSAFLVPDTPAREWPGMHAVPLSINASKPDGIVIILDEPSAADVATMARIYPHANFEITTAPNRSEPLLYTIVIPAADIEAMRGVHASVSEPGATTPKEEKSVPEFSYDWSNSGVRTGTVRMSSTLKIEQFGQYKFHWKGAGGSEGPREFQVDGYSLLSGQPISLGLGLHSLVATDTVKSGSGMSQLMWSLPGGGQQPLPASNLFDPRRIEPRGLTGLLRAGSGFDTISTNGRVDPVISFYFHQTLLPRPYTVEWNGRLYAPEEGVYVLGTENLSSSRLFLDGKETINNSAINNMMEAQVPLTVGFHDLRILYTDLDQASHMYLYWTPPGRGHSKIPAAFLFPQMGQYPDRPESGPLPTLEQSDGTILPEDRVVYWPPRAQAMQPAQNPPPGQPQQAVQQPPQQEPEQAPEKGELLKPTFLIGAQGAGLQRPRAAAADSAGNIYIYTEVDSKIHKYSPEGKLLASWDVKNATGEKLKEGSALVILGDNIHVLDSDTSDLISFSLDGTPVGRMHLCQCFFPRGIIVSKDGNFWVASTGQGKLMKVSPSGQQVLEYGQGGQEPGKFLEPASVWESPEGELVVADIGNKRAQSFSADFKPIAQWPIGQSIARDGNRLVGDGSGNILVTQYDDRAVVMYDKNGKELNRWTFRRGGAPAIPAGIASLGGNKIIVLYPNDGIAAVFNTK